MAMGLSLIRVNVDFIVRGNTVRNNGNNSLPLSSIISRACSSKKKSGLIFGMQLLA